MSPSLSGQVQDSVVIDLLTKAYYTSDSDSSDYYYQLVKDTITTVNQQGLYHYYLMYTYARANQYDSCKAHGDQAIAYFKESDNEEYLLQTYHKLMQDQIDQGSLEYALSYNLAGLRLCEHRQDTAQIAHYLGDRATIYHDFEQYRKGVDIGKEGVKLLDVFSEATGLDYLHVMNTIAINYDDWGKGDSALYYYDIIIGKNEGLPVNDDLTIIYNNMGNTLLKQGKVGEAKNYLIKAYNYDKDQTYYYQTSTSANNLGSVYRKLQQWDSARYYLDIAAVSADSSGSIEKKRDVYYTLYELAKDTRQFEEAMDYQQQYYALKDSIFRDDRAKIIADMETRYETDKKDREIVILNQENAIQKASNQRNATIIGGLVVVIVLLAIVFYLWRQRSITYQREVLNEQKIRMREAQIKAVINGEEKERKRFAADLHDRMGQQISALTMNIQSLRTRQDDKHLRDEIFENTTHLLADIQREIRNIAFNLMPQVLTKEGLIPALEELASRISKSHRVSMQVQVYGVEQRLSEVLEISLYRILQEWISNVLKYAQATEIYVQFTEHDEELIITVEDNGQGFDLSQFKNSKGNGWRNINTRLALIQAEMDLDTMVGRKNTTLTITVSLINATNTHMSSVYHNVQTTT